MLGISYLVLFSAAGYEVAGVTMVALRSLVRCDLLRTSDRRSAGPSGMNSFG